MTPARPRTARQLAPGSHSAGVYRRPLLRVFAAAMWLFQTGGLAWALVVGSGTNHPDDLGRQHFWIPLFFVPVLGGFYLYAASTLVTTSAGVTVRNPLRRVDIPFAQITGVEAGRNLQVVTAHRRFTSAGVEGANIQVAFGSTGTPGRPRAADRTGRARWPGPFTLLVAAANLACLGEILVVGGPLTG